MWDLSKNSSENYKDLYFAWKTNSMKNKKYDGKRKPYF